MASIPKSEFLRVMQERGLIHSCTDMYELDREVCENGIVAYVGYDATAPSLHIGHLMNIVALRWLGKLGGKPIALLGGGTTKVGDPSFRTTARPMLDDDGISINIDGIRSTMNDLLAGCQDRSIINNAEWLEKLEHLDFMREIGSKFSVNRMLSFDSVHSRLSDGGTISFFEFGYMVLQAYDFLILSRQENCRLQMGGSDQWGNIINGIELARKVDGAQLFGLTTPLLTNAAGEKMGKTGHGTVWLNGSMLSPYEFWQFWRNVDDADVGRFLKFLTEIPVVECERLGALKGVEINHAKIILADQITGMVHGAGASAIAKANATAVFGGRVEDADMRTLDVEADGLVLSRAVVLAGRASSGKEAKRKIHEGAVRINGVVVTETGHVFHPGTGTHVVNVGRKDFFRVRC